MFKSTKPNVFESSEGFSVEVLGRAGLSYREGNRTMFVNSEVLMGPSGMAVYRKSITRWDAPHDNEVIEQADRERILENIRDAFRFQGFDIVII
jgi:hypothetical protein